MILMLSRNLHALVVLDMNFELVMANHGVAKKTELMTGLLRLVVDQLGSKVLLDRFLGIKVLLAMHVGEDLRSGSRVADITFEVRIVVVTRVVLGIFRNLLRTKDGNIHISFSPRGVVMNLRLGMPDVLVSNWLEHAS